MSVVVVPDDWDAWAIWGSKARVLAQGTGPLYDVTRFGHPDYPLLWPTIWAFSGWLTGGWKECWSKGWGAVFLLFSVWEMIHIVREQGRSLTIGLLAGAPKSGKKVIGIIKEMPGIGWPFGEWILKDKSIRITQSIQITEETVIKGDPSEVKFGAKIAVRGKKGDRLFTAYEVEIVPDDAAAYASN